MNYVKRYFLNPDTEMLAAMLVFYHSYKFPQQNLNTVGIALGTFALITLAMLMAYHAMARVRDRAVILTVHQLHNEGLLRLRNV